MVVDGAPAVLPRLSVQLPDGRVGYYQRSNEALGGCLAAAVATFTESIRPRFYLLRRRSRKWGRS